MHEVAVKMIMILQKFQEKGVVKTYWFKFLPKYSSEDVCGLKKKIVNCFDLIALTFKCLCLL
jgi:hypothetical protein